MPGRKRERRREIGHNMHLKDEDHMAWACTQERVACEKSGVCVHIYLLGVLFSAGVYSLLGTKMPEMVA